MARNSIGIFFTGGGPGAGGGPMGDVGAAGGGQYWSVFMKRLGLTTVEIGLLRSISSAVNMLLAVPFGFLTDRAEKMKKLYLVGRVTALPISLVRYLTKTWPFCILVSVWESLSLRIMMPSSQIIMINSLSNEDRVSGLSINRAIMGVAGMIGPMVCALIINYFGGLDSADSIRPLFLIQFVVGLFTMVFLVTQMQEVTVTRGKREPGVLGHLFGVFKEVPVLKLLLLRQCVNMFLMNVGMPFLTIYMVDVKGADEFILGWRGTVRTALAVCLSIPIGRLAERIGRRRVAYFGRVFGWAGLFVMIRTPPTHPEYLIIAGVLESLRMLMFVGWMAFDQELVPIEARGRYSGVSMMMNGMVGVIAPILGGLMWEFNPDYLWWIRILGGALVVLPLMIIIGNIASKSET